MFDSTKTALHDLLRQAETGKLQLPDFQRSWVWDDYGIRSLLASISQSFPVGAVMMLQAGGEIRFRNRPLEGLPAELQDLAPEYYLLDGQQRLTSLYQACIGRSVIRTMNAQRRRIDRWYYIDMARAIDGEDREEAFIGVPESRIVHGEFGRVVRLDLSTPAREYEQRMFPVNRLFDDREWERGFDDYWRARDVDVRDFYRDFHDRIIRPFQHYQVPVISLHRTSSREAVCLVFEKVNTGGKKLDAFELLTAIYAANGYPLREDWLGPDDDPAGKGRRDRLAQHNVLSQTASTDFLQAIALLHSLALREAALAAGKEGKELPPVSCGRKAILSLPLEAYRRWADTVEDAFVKAAKFLTLQKVFKVKDVPYLSQIVPLAAILARLGDDWRNAGVRQRLARWYWCGVFGELYGSAVEGRMAKDIQEVPAWVRGAGERPSTVIDAAFSPDRLLYLSSRLSAAYKGVTALLMAEGARDFQSGQPYEYTNFWDENVDIHHIFPKAWCRSQGVDGRSMDSVINKTPLSSAANRAIGGVAPSKYVARLEERTGLDGPDLDRLLASHAIPAAALRADDFAAFFAQRRERLLDLIARATDIRIHRDEGESDEPMGEEVIDREREPRVDIDDNADALGA